MPQQNRVNLKSYFLTGAKPTQNQFWELIDSVINLKDDPISIDGSGNPVLTKGITIGNSSLDTVGTIRWNNTSFQFRDNAGWHDLSLTAGGSQWTTIGANINLAAGNVGVGVAAGPTYKLEVTTNASVAPTVNNVDAIRLGSTVTFNDNFSTYISHRNMANFTSYALSQDGGGSVIINSAAGKTISFFDGGSIKAFIQGGALTIGATPGVATT